MATYDATTRFLDLMEVLSNVYGVLPIEEARKIWNIYEKPFEENWEPWESGYFRSFLEAAVKTMKNGPNPYNKPMRFDLWDDNLVLRNLTEEQYKKIRNLAEGRYYIPNWRECDSLIRHGYVQSEATERLRDFLIHDLDFSMEDAEKKICEFYASYNTGMELLDPPAKLLIEEGIEMDEIDGSMWEEKLGPISLDLFNEAMLKAFGGFSRKQNNEAMLKAFGGFNRKQNMQNI